VATAKALVFGTATHQQVPKQEVRQPGETTQILEPRIISDPRITFNPSKTPFVIQPEAVVTSLSTFKGVCSMS
jgi:hypothetical protein